jgi:hypothetical protein
MSAEILNDFTNIIKHQINKYSSSDYMMQRMKHHINSLPSILENELKTYEEKLNRTTYLTNEQQIFIQVFLSNNKYFYLSNNNTFYEYNGEKYLIVQEDEIIHKLLSSISKERTLLEWKHKTKTNIIKLIKERNLFNSIPETDTIQNVLNMLYPSFFQSKNTAKYFLTIIGDNILKKNGQLIFLVSQKMKQFLNEIDNVAISSIGNNNSTHNFMTKYHENHSYTSCRLIQINENFSSNVWRELLKKIGLDLLCVAAHYSTRYENSDAFIENKADEELKSYTYYLKNNNPTNIINEFCSKYIINTSSTDCKMEWKNLHFVWKQFLFAAHLPNMIYSNVLKNLLKELYSYNESSDSFICITSKYLPVHSDFIKFWDQTIQQEATDNELEVDELSSLFKVWAKEQKEQKDQKGELTNVSISEENIIKILKHFFPNIEISEDKYILNVKSTMWDKIQDMETSFVFMKEWIQTEYKLALISFDDVYNYYYKFCNTQEIKFIVSKRYFEKYLYFKVKNHIVYEKFIEKSWFLLI